MFSQDWLEGAGFSKWWKLFLAVVLLMMVGGWIGTALDENVGEVLLLIFYILMLGLWIVAGISGVVLLRRKYYLTFKSAGIALLLFGWWVPIFLYLGGPLVWWIARSLKPRRKCPACKQIIPGDATRCPYCGADVKPII